MMWRCRVRNDAFVRKTKVLIQELLETNLNAGLNVIACLANTENAQTVQKLTDQLILEEDQIS
jgi:hypothetical protein